MGFMEVKDEADWLPSMRRTLIQGPPNSWKTSSLRTWPHSKEQPMVILSCPGEQGHNSIPREDGVKALIWRRTPEEKLDSLGVFNEVKSTIIQTIASRPHVLAIDGIHNLAAYALDAAGGGTLFKGEDFEIERAFGKLDPYTKSYQMMVELINTMTESPVPYVVVTAWDGREPDVKAVTGQEYNREKSRVYPEFPGRLAKKVMGMFPLVLYSSVQDPPVPGEKDPRAPVGWWQLKADNQVGGAAAKVPVHVQQRLPVRVKQDWQALEKLLGDLAQGRAV